MKTQKQLAEKFLDSFAKHPSRLFPLAEMVSLFTDERIETHRQDWDIITPSVGREWYQKREAGLRAYGRYEANLLLKPFAVKDTAGNRSIRADKYIELLIHAEIQKNGLDALSKWTCDFFQWEDFLKWKRLNDPEFFIRLGQWLYRGKEMKDYYPDPRIRLYANLFDRFEIPLEFGTDEFAADAINAGLKNPSWRGSRRATTFQAVRAWHRVLRLKTVKPPIASIANRHGGKIKFDYDAARRIGLPFDPDAALQNISDLRANPRQL